MFFWKTFRHQNIATAIFTKYLLAFDYHYIFISVCWPKSFTVHRDDCHRCRLLHKFNRLQLLGILITWSIHLYGRNLRFPKNKSPKRSQCRKTYDPQWLMKYLVKPPEQLPLFPYGLPVLRTTECRLSSLINNTGVSHLSQVINAVLRFC